MKRIATKNVVRKEVRAYSASGSLISAKTWRVKKLASKKTKKVAQ